MPRHAFVVLIDELRRGKTTRLVPTLKDGKPIGVKVYAMTPGTFVDAIGLTNGDTLIAIDDVKLATADPKQLAIDKFRSEGNPARARHPPGRIALDPRHRRVVTRRAAAQPAKAARPAGGPLVTGSLREHGERSGRVVGEHAVDPDLGEPA